MVQSMSQSLKVMKTNGPEEEALKRQMIAAVQNVAAQNQKDSSKAGLGDKEWHLFNKSQLFETLQTQDKGLTKDEHARRLVEYGLNELTPPPVRHWFLKFLDTLAGGFQIMMLVGALLCFIVVGVEWDL
jgi:magnesium-transporting ATPase (P-type)